MSLNSYQWELYLQSKGKETIEGFKKFLSGQFEGYPEFISKLVSAFCPDDGLIQQVRVDALDFVEQISEYRKDVPIDELASEDERMAELAVRPMTESDYQDAKDEDPYADQWAQIEANTKGTRDHLGKFYRFIEYLTFNTQMKAYLLPTRYFPYYYAQMFCVLQDVANFFEIQLPAVPGKKQLAERIDYYQKLCECFYAFAIENKMSIAELWAFLYDYGPACVGGKEWVREDLPEPRSVFVFGMGQAYPEKHPGSVCIMQGSPDMQIGDIGMLYHWAPDKCYTSIWRAVSTGYFDPLTVHDRQVCYGRPIEIPHITYAELKVDPVFSQTSLVKTNMLRMDGAPMLPSEYMHLLDMARAKGPVPENVPVFERRDDAAQGTFLLERDVEEQLLEPLLLRLGWTPENWCRQMPVRIGRGTSKYPDYVINPVYTKNHEHGDIVLEAKLTIPNQKQLEVDRGQAHSYAKLLGARAYVLVAKESIWLSISDDDFTSIKGYTWEELKDADKFSALYKLIGNRQKRVPQKKK